MPMLAVPHQDTLLADGAKLVAALLSWNEHAGWGSKDANVCYGGLMAIKELKGRGILAGAGA